MPFVPVIRALFSVVQMLYLPEGARLRLVIWMGIGLIVYFSYGRRHSALRQRMGKIPKRRQPLYPVRLEYFVDFWFRDTAFSAD